LTILDLGFFQAKFLNRFQELEEDLEKFQTSVFNLAVPLYGTSGVSKHPD
jgi:hypothetical protein